MSSKNSFKTGTAVYCWIIETKVTNKLNKRSVSYFNFQSDSTSRIIQDNSVDLFLIEWILEDTGRRSFQHMHDASNGRIDTTDCGTCLHML